MDDITQALTHIVLRKTIPFCYPCYARSPSGKNATCGSDDLMNELPGVGVEYGTDWLLTEKLREHLDPANTLEAFEQSVADCYSDTVKIGWIEYDTATAIRELDTVSWEIAHRQWIDVEISNGNLCTFDNGFNYYLLNDIEQFIEGSAAESYVPVV